MLCGGISQCSLDDELAIESINKAIDEHNQANNTSLTFDKFQSLTSQVVAGVRFRGVAQVRNQGIEELYNFDIWRKPGTQGIEVTKFLRQ